MENPATLPIIGYTGAASSTVQLYWLDAAWRALQREDRALVHRISSGDLDPLTVADVVTAAARRVLRNPEGVQSESGGIDDYTESWKRADPTEDIYFTAAELRRLQSVGVGAGGWSGSVKYA